MRDLQGSEGDVPQSSMVVAVSVATLKCPNGCGPLQPFNNPGAHGWECPKCGYFHNTKTSPVYPPT